MVQSCQVVTMHSPGNNSSKQLAMAQHRGVNGGVDAVCGQAVHSCLPLIENTNATCGLLCYSYYGHMTTSPCEFFTGLALFCAWA